MDQLWAIKQNVDPFPATVSFVNYNPLAIFRCTVYRCPYCRWIFKVTWGPSNSLVGRGERACWHCKQVFSDYSNEWPEMSAGDRSLFLVPITVAGYLGALLIIGGIYAYDVFYFKRPASYGDLIFFIAFALPLVAWFTFRSVQVIRSIRRYNGRGETTLL